MANLSNAMLCVNEYDYNSDARLVRELYVWMLEVVWMPVKAHQNFRNICAYQTLFAMLYHQIIVVKCHISPVPSVCVGPVCIFLCVIAKDNPFVGGVLNRNNSMSDQSI